MRIEEEIKQDKFKNVHHQALVNLIYTSNWIQHLLQNFLKTFDITQQQFNILRILRGQYPHTISAKEIKARMLDRNSDVSRLLDRLDSKKLIVKRTCPNDKRAADVLISERGLELLEKIDAAKAPSLHLDDEEAAFINDLLNKSRG